MRKVYSFSLDAILYPLFFLLLPAPSKAHLEQNRKSLFIKSKLGKPEMMGTKDLIASG